MHMTEICYATMVIAGACAALLLVVEAMACRFSRRWRERRWRREVEERSCNVCRKRRTMACPNSAACWGTEGKPFFEAEEPPPRDNR